MQAKYQIASHTPPSLLQAALHAYAASLGWRRGGLRHMGSTAIAMRITGKQVIATFLLTPEDAVTVLESGDPTILLQHNRVATVGG